MKQTRTLLLAQKTPFFIRSMFSRLSRNLAFILLLTGTPVAVHSAPDPAGGYLFVTFRHEGINGEQLYFALSRDGRVWSALNHSKPVLGSTIGDQGVRDPFLLRTQDGKFVLIATDLSIYRRRSETKNGAETWKQSVQAGSRSMVIWESSDLIHWDGPRLAEVGAKDAGCVWAPEAIYDPDASDYLVFWASTSPGDQFKKQRIWASHTKDFRTFSPSFVYQEGPTSLIDTSIVRDGDVYYRFTKDAGHATILMESAPKLSGPWSEIPGFALKGVSGIEGPECYLLNRDSPDKPKLWCLIADFYAKSLGYQPFVTGDLSKGNFQPGEGFVFPFKFRHGTVLPVSEEEYQRIEKAFR